MSFFVEVDSNAAEAAAEAQSGGKGFAPLPQGNYQARIVPLKKDGNRVEVADFGGTGPNGKKKVLRVAVQILDASPLGNKRWFAARVPLFTRYAPNEKNPQGAPARMYFDFLRAIGVSEDDIIAGRFPDVDKFMGKEVGITLSAPIEPDKWNPLGSNEISFFNKPGDVRTTPRYKEGEPKAPWLDKDDNLILDYPFVSDNAKAYIAELTGQAPVAAAQAATPSPSWATTPGGAAPGTPAPSWAVAPEDVASAENQAVAAPNVTPGPWGQQASSGLQAAADAAVGM